MNHEEVGPEWREAATSSSQSMLEDCNYWISRLQPRKRTLTPEECFHLWSELGYLRFHIWSKTLSKEESDVLGASAQKLQEQLSEAVVRYTVPHAKTSILLVRLEDEMINVIEKIQHWISRANQLLKEHNPRRIMGSDGVR